jgi:hypothetical protein
MSPHGWGCADRDDDRICPREGFLLLVKKLKITTVLFGSFI